LVLPEGYNSFHNLDYKVKVYTHNEWLALERERQIKILLDE